MASLFKRRRGFLLKILVLVPVVYMFSLLVFSAGIKRTFPFEDNGIKELLVKRDQNALPDNTEKTVSKVRIEQVQTPEKQIEVNVLNTATTHQEVNHRAQDVKNDLGPEGVVKMDMKAEDVKRSNLRNVQQVVNQAHDPNAPGENGKGINIEKNKLSPEERKKFDDGFKNNAYNQYASDMMSFHRSLPDVRDKECLNQKYKANLPETSVVICFHNEAWSVLLRTVHSVIDRTPPHLLKEIILVDDFSDMEHLKKPLEDYIAKLGIVKITRNSKREGLIRSRLAGFSMVQAEVVTFLDSHCECAEGWLEPLLDRIAANESNVVCPVIDVIDDETLKYQQSSNRLPSIGGFDWNMQFSWHVIPDHERKRRTSEVSPIRSPTMAGGLFAISKKYFEKLGTYDDGMDIWGGENLEISFKIWMCGGILEIVPCSHVGHIFRKRSPYKWRTGVNVVKKNSIRVAEVWMDNYKKYYYERFNFDLGDYGNITSRKELRNNLDCKSFEWYINNIYPELFVPGDADAAGEIRSKAQPTCIDSPADRHSYHKTVNMWPCHNQGGNQFWMLSSQGQIRRDDGCLDYSGGDNVIIYPCHGQKGNQEWRYTEDNALMHVNTQKCAEVSVDGKKLMMKKCTGIDRQIWQWKRTPSEKVIQKQ